MMVSASHLSVSRMKGSQMDSRACHGSGMFSSRTSLTPSILRVYVCVQACYVSVGGGESESTTILETHRASAFSAQPYQLACRTLPPPFPGTIATRMPTAGPPFVVVDMLTAWIPARRETPVVH